MKNIRFIVLGALFGIVLSKAEVISWYRIYEMFKFQSFHMYGIIGSAVVLGIILFSFFKKGTIKSVEQWVENIPKKNGQPFVQEDRMQCEVPWEPVEITNDTPVSLITRYIASLTLSYSRVSRVLAQMIAPAEQLESMMSNASEVSNLSIAAGGKTISFIKFCHTCIRQVYR